VTEGVAEGKEGGAGGAGGGIKKGTIGRVEIPSVVRAITGKGKFVGQPATKKKKKKKGTQKTEGR